MAAALDSHRPSKHRQLCCIQLQKLTHICQLTLLVVASTYVCMREGTIIASLDIQLLGLATDIDVLLGQLRAFNPSMAAKTFATPGRDQA